jgi:hypothetical protein
VTVFILYDGVKAFKNTPQGQWDKHPIDTTADDLCHRKHQALLLGQQYQSGLDIYGPSGGRTSGSSVLIAYNLPVQSA